LITKIVEDAYQVLETQGVNLNHELLLRKLADLGCLVDLAAKRVWIGRDLVTKCLATCPHEVQLWNVAGTASAKLAGDAVHFTPGSAAIKILDPAMKLLRLATVNDILRYSRLVERLEHIDFGSTALVPSDVPEQIGDSIRLYALLKLTSKPIVTGAFTIAGFDVMTDLQLSVRGTRDALRAKPFAMFSCCPTSPLKWSDVTSDNTMKCAELGIPVEFVTMPMAGLVSPVTLVGSLVQHTAETMSGIVISQVSSPGAPLVYGGSPSIFDMRTMSAAISAVAAQMMACAHTEIGKHLKLPTQAYIGLSDSRDLDGQAGFETGTGAYLAALAGINSVSGPGMLYFESCLSLEKLAFDNEICGMAQRLIAGIVPQEDLPAGELFEELVRERTLLGSDHTLRNFRRAHYLPGPTLNRTQDDSASFVRQVDRARRQVDGLVDGHPGEGILTADQLSHLEEVMRHAAGDYQVAF
jgi:trimethylamine--corrinoid protein Co-methyltransferase